MLQIRIRTSFAIVGSLVAIALSSCEQANLPDDEIAKGTRLQRLYDFYGANDGTSLKIATMRFRDTTLSMDCSVTDTQMGAFCLPQLTPTTTTVYEESTCDHPLEGLQISCASGAAIEWLVTPTRNESGCQVSAMGSIFHNAQRRPMRDLFAKYPSGCFQLAVGAAAQSWYVIDPSSEKPVQLSQFVAFKHTTKTAEEVEAAANAGK